ncbi:F-box domain, Tubby domain-containing protein [Artemisia annua]|uniref:F-box domain, Tubby domain-containing protein n=1 Tax=Artemisia annua TaxID=35608 RepID=A0A2U1KTS7_ARTAN|nr:F-box domain, Tubby domain-containing protein [Artemisia annua]
MRVEVSESTWPMRKNVVYVAGVCKRWRSVVKEIVNSREGSGVLTFPSELKQRWRSVVKEIVCSREGSEMLTFPSELKQPGSVGSLTKCLIKRNRRTQTYKLYLILNEASNNDGVLRGKFLLAARRFRRAKCTDYIISLSAEDISEESSTYMGKSKFLGTKFTVYDSSAGSYPISSISYEVNAKGPSIDIPGTMRCVLNSIPTNATEPGLGPTPTEFHLSNVDHFQSHQLLWCACCINSINFSVTASSLKRLQLISSLENESGTQENKNVILRYGRVGKDVFRVDYQYPISAFQAFAICLSSFDTKLAWNDYQHKELNLVLLK